MSSLEVLKTVYEAMPQVFVLNDILQNEKIDPKQCKRFLDDKIVEGKLTIRTYQNFCQCGSMVELEVFIKAN